MSRIHVKTFGLLVVIAVLTSGCAVGFGAATNQQKASGNGRSADVGHIQVRNALIVKDPSKPGAATFVGTIINSGSDTDKLQSLTVRDPHTGTPAIFSASKSLEPGDALAFGLKGQLSIPISLNPDLAAGSHVKVDLGFEINALIEMYLLVENNDGIYSEVTVAQ